MSVLSSSERRSAKRMQKKMKDGPPAPHDPEDGSRSLFGHTFNRPWNHHNPAATAAPAAPETPAAPAAPEAPAAPAAPEAPASLVVVKTDDEVVGSDVSESTLSAEDNTGEDDSDANGGEGEEPAVQGDVDHDGEVTVNSVEVSTEPEVEEIEP